jgi:uncharacterized protein YqjF (DUF2071 family)
MSETFLSARWQRLVMLNWAVEPALLEARVPRGTVLDREGGHVWISAVGFLFLDTRVLGLPIPLHRDFEELNLRFYVRRDVPDPIRGLPNRRGVVFVKELVPLPAVAWVARTLYGENYEARPMRNELRRGEALLDQEGALQPGDHLSYGWQSEDGLWGEIGGEVEGAAQPLVAGSHPHFIAEHYWGYAAQRDGGTMEYEVEHPPWQVHALARPFLRGDLIGLYGAELAHALNRPPDTAWVADGSEIKVNKGHRLER